MPYEIVKSGSKFTVRKKGGGKVFGTHPTHEKAVAQLRALYANTADTALSNDPSDATILSLSASDSDTQATKNPKVFWKEIAHVGNFVKGDTKFSIDDGLLNHWHSTFGKMSSKGMQIPVPVEHTRDPEKRRGRVLELAVKPNSRGLNALYAKIKFRDHEAAKLSQSGVSIFVPRSAKDGYGGQYDIPIEHVAITDYPVITDLEPFHPIALSFEAGDMTATKFDPNNSVLTRDIDTRFSTNGGGLALDFPSAGSGDKKPDGPPANKPAEAPPAQQQQQQPPQPGQITLKDLAAQLGIDASVTDQNQLLQSISNMIGAMKARLQTPQVAQQQPPMPPQMPGAPRPGMPPMMPQVQPHPMQQPMQAVHTGRQPMAMARYNISSYTGPVAFSLDDIPEEILMSLSKKQMKKVVKAIKKGKASGGGKVKDAGIDDHNSKSHFGKDSDDDCDDTYTEENDHFGGDSETEEDTLSGKGKAGLSNTALTGLALSGSVLDLVKSARQVTINNLFSKGVINSASKKQLEADYIAAPAVAFSHEYDDGFTKMVKLLEANGRVLPGGKSGPQSLDGVVALSQGENANNNPILADVNRRLSGKLNY